MKLSIIDLSVVPYGGNRHEAIINTVDTAQKVEEWGFVRIWLAEHHATNGAIGRAPEVLIPLVASKTNKIRVGSGSVLLNHYSPYKVAENFSLLAEMFPGRIDMGIGRATNGLYVDLALQRLRQERIGTDDSEAQVTELATWFNGDFDSRHPFSTINFSRDYIPDFWLLGSSAFSAQTAAALGLPYAFAGFINPQQSFSITQLYKSRFVPSSKTVGVQEPKLILALWVYCTETDEEAQRMVAPVMLAHKRMMQGDIRFVMESEEQAVEMLGGLPEIEPLNDPRFPPRYLMGTPEKLEKWITAIAAAYGADEIMIQCATRDHAKRLRSLQLLAKQFGLY